MRRPGAAALDLCYVAAGHTDGFFETGLSPWDIAAGSLLITEAGGLIGNFTGEADYLYQREVVAGSPKIYGQLVTLLSPYTRVIHADAPAAEAGDGTDRAPNVIPNSRPNPPSPPSSAWRQPAAAPTPAPAPRKAATRISKESMAREKQAAADAERKPPRPRTPHGGDAPF